MLDSKLEIKRLRTLLNYLNTNNLVLDTHLHFINAKRILLRGLYPLLELEDKAASKETRP